MPAFQETHSSLLDDQIWQKEWSGKIYYSHGRSNSIGVAILIPDNIFSDIKVTNIKTDQNGRLNVLECKDLYGSICHCVYLPTKDKPTPQLLSKYGK